VAVQYRDRRARIDVELRRSGAVRSALSGGDDELPPRAQRARTDARTHRRRPAVTALLRSPPVMRTHSIEPPRRAVLFLNADRIHNLERTSAVLMNQLNESGSAV